MSRSRCGTGCVYRRGGTWWIKFFRKGKPVYESSQSDNRQKAEDLLKVRLGDIVVGRDQGPLPERCRMSDLFADVVEDYRFRNLASLPDVESRIKLHLGPVFGLLFASEITTQDMKRYVAARRSAKASEATINRELAIVRRGFSLAVAADPPKLLRAPKVPRLEEENVRSGFVEHAQYIRLRNELPDHVRLLLVVGYHTGIRVGELRKIRWEQVDLSGGEIRLGGPQTKNKKPRTVPIYGEMREWLTWAKQHQADKWPGCDWVFSRHGRQIGDFRKAWTAACKRVGLDGLLFHDLRRSAVRNMERAGIPRKVAMAISGHRTESVYRRYDIVSRQDLVNAAAKLESYLTGQNAPAEAENFEPGALKRPN